MDMPVTAHNKSEWSRLAKDAYSKGVNYLGHRYSAAAALPDGAAIPIDRYDILQYGYRRWLIQGFAGWND